jgi:hypothetical protein
LHPYKDVKIKNSFDIYTPIGDSSLFLLILSIPQHNIIS